jgi:hypothetical protein
MGKMPIKVATLILIMLRGFCPCFLIGAQGATLLKCTA